MGRYVIALASARGIRTLNVVRRTDAVDQVRDAGGDRVVVADGTLAARISEALGGGEVSLVLDPIGGPAVPELAAALKFGGTVVSYGGLSGRPPIVRPQDLIFKEVRLTGFWLVNWLRNAPREEIEQTYRALADLVAAGQLAGPVAATYPLADYRRAFEHALTTTRDGKILFTFGDLG